MSRYIDRIKRFTAALCALSIVTVSGSVSGAGSVWKTANAAESTEEAETKVVTPVTFSKGSGAYDNAFLLELTAGENKIYYTTDGSNPINSDTRIEYTSPVSVQDRSEDENELAAIDTALYDSAYVKWDSKNKKFVSRLKTPSKEDVDKATVIRAVSVDANGEYSEVGTNTYFIGSMDKHIAGIKESCDAAGVDMSVMSLVVQKEDFFDSEKGIYVHGDIFDKALQEYLDKYGSINSAGAAEVARGLDANYKQKGRDWEREIHMDYFESNGEKTECLLQQDCGVRIQGNYSRSDLQKGLRLYARKEYGKKNFSYPFFENAKDDTGETIDKYKKITLRNGGNCAFTTKYSDAYWQSLISEMKAETQASRVCAVYLNGEYWGIYILQQDYDDTYFEQTHGVNKDDVIVYKGDAEALALGYKLDEGSLPEGETDESYYFQELITFCKNHTNLKSNADYTAFAKIVDPESVRDYFAVNVWVNNKWDWPGKNWSMWKTATVDETNPYADGRFRFCYYDLDFGGVSGGSDASTNTLEDDKLLSVDRWLYEKNYINPAALSFAMFMTNEGFRGEFEKSLRSLTKNQFEANTAVAACTKYLNTYKPLYNQFFTRYGFDGEYYSEEAENGGYASYRCIVEFIQNRKEAIEEMISWIEEYYNPIVYLAEEEVVVKAGGSQKVQMEVLNTSFSKLTISSSNTKIVKAQKNNTTGVLTVTVPKTATKGSSAFIKIMYGKKVLTKLKVYVKNPAKKLAIQKKYTIKKGSEKKITCRIIGENAKKVCTQDAEVAILNENIASLNNYYISGKNLIIDVEGLKKGTTIMKITVGKKTVKVKIMVK